MGLCRDCKWWDHEPFGTGLRPPIKDGEYRHCILLERSSQEYGQTFNPKWEGLPDQLAYAAGDEHVTGFFTSPNFGCVQFEPEIEEKAQ